VVDWPNPDAHRNDDRVGTSKANNDEFEAVFDLKPRRAGEVLDDAIRLARMGFWRIAPIVVIGSIPPSLLAYLVVVSVGGDDVSTNTIIGAVLVLAVLLPFSILLLSGAAMVDLYHQAMGTPITRRAALKRTIRRVPALFVHLIALFVVQMVAQIGVNMVTSIPSFLLGAVMTQVPILGGILFFILVIAVYLMQFAILGRFVLGIPAVVIDKTGPFTAIGRAFRLTEGQTWATGLVLFYASLLSSAVALVVTVPIAIIMSTLLPGDITPAMLIIGYTGVGLAGYTFLSALLVILFINGRVRREGMDLHLSAERLGFPEPPPFVPHWLPQPGMFIPQNQQFTSTPAPGPWQSN
jgi:hypothetical protein